MLINIILVILAYLIGSIPSAVWIGKKYYGIDVREHGSKNAGATNTFRLLGRKAGLIVFTMDFIKGFIAVSLCHFSDYFMGSDAMFSLKIALTIAVVLGHIFPLYAGFKGGKGVATLAGSVLAVYPSAFLICLAIFLLCLTVTHYVSLSSIITGICFPILIIGFFKEQSAVLVIFSIAIAILLTITHQKNIKRLLDGTESKMYLFKK